MEFFHLSHTDLDGYTCQFITKKLYEDGYFTNANYGEEVLVRIKEIIQKIEESESKKTFFLITDLNLNKDEATYLDEEIKRLQTFKDVKLQLLDHHASGLETSETFHWYHLDVTKSASKITYHYFYNERIAHLQQLINAVNAVDIWLQEESLFEFGKVLMRMIDEAKEINRYTFNSENIAYKHFMLQSALPFLQKESGYILLDESICSIKKSYFLKKQNDTLDNLLTAYLVNLLTLHKERMSIFFQESKGVLTYGIQNSSTVGNAFLKANPDFHFFMNINPKGTFSLRADNKIDVSKMAELIAGGGGHPNASGGRLKEFKEFFVYDELKNYIGEVLQNFS